MTVPAIAITVVAATHDSAVIASILSSILSTIVGSHFLELNVDQTASFLSSAFFVSVLCAAHVIIVHMSLDHSHAQTTRKKVAVGVKKALTFSAKCNLLAAPLILCLGVSFETTLLVVSSWIIGYGAIGAIIGVTYTPPLMQDEE